MRSIVYAALAAAILTSVPPSSAAAGALESSWSDAGLSNTLVSESGCTAVSGPRPYNFSCTFSALATNLIAATPKRGQCTETLVTIGPRRVLGPCEARFSITMKVNRVRTDDSTTVSAFVCNGTSLDQNSGGAEPVPLKGSFHYTSSDGVVRQVPVDVAIVSNVLKFTGSAVGLFGDGLVDEVRGSFPVRCSPSTGIGFSGEYKFVM